MKEFSVSRHLVDLYAKGYSCSTISRDVISRGILMSPARVRDSLKELGVEMRQRESHLEKKRYLQVVKPRKDGVR